MDSISQEEMNAILAERAKKCPEVRSLTMDEAGLLGVDKNGRLYWGVHPIKIQKILSLNGWQTTIAVLAASGTFMAGLGTLLPSITSLQY